MKNLFLSILRKKLKILAKLTLARYNPGLVGITGTVGKTSTKEAIRAVLSRDRRVRAPGKSFNNELGLPLTILGDWTETGGVFFWMKVILKSISQLVFKKSNYPEVLVLEYGVDRPGDMKYLLEIARPQIGVFTAMGEIPVHVEFFAGPEGVFREKAKMISQLPTTGFSVLNADDAVVMEARNQTRSQIVTFGFSEKADMRISGFTEHLDGKNSILNFKLTYGGSFVPVRLENVLGKGQAYSVAAASLVGLIFGMNLVKIAEAFNNYESPAGRLKLIPALKEALIIDDTYNASPLAMEEALETLRSLEAKRKIAVLGDMLEIGRYTLEAHEAVGRLAAKNVDLLITVGLRGKFIAESAARAGLSKKSISSFMTLPETVAFLRSVIKKGDLILFKGSQGVRLEKVIKEIMLAPSEAEKILVRQSEKWLKTPGLYDEALSSSG
ncbi:MAG: UDP-N-acetylmuramoyl-tripeptide--D-alanyl-D-alanine ligase [Patescibacteria group bacterium]